jgi:hypothetical protein
MFDQKEVAAYRSISAPDSLRDKVLSSCANMAPKKRNPREYMRMVSSIAACFVLVAVLAVFGAQSYGHVSVSLSGEKLREDQSMIYHSPISAQVASMYREREGTAVLFEFDGHAALSVSDGVMAIVDADTQDILYTGTEYAIDGKTLVNWTVHADDTAKTFEMTVRGAFKTEKIILTYDADENEWSVIRKEVK